MAIPMTLLQWLSQTHMPVGEFARAAGIHPTTASRLLRGRHWPNGATALRIYELSGGAVSVWNVDYYAERQRPKRKAAA